MHAPLSERCRAAGSLGSKPLTPTRRAWVISHNQKCRWAAGGKLPSVPLPVTRERSWQTRCLRTSRARGSRQRQFHLLHEMRGCVVPPLPVPREHSWPTRCCSGMARPFVIDVCTAVI